VGWPRGLLIGLAAALKLTPAVFILYFIARRDWKAAGTSVAGFLAVTGIGFLLAPHDSVTYWTKMVFQTGRIGPVAFSSNQSITGVLYRAHQTGAAESALWLLSAACVVAAALIGVSRAARAGRPIRALALTASTELLVSPISWSHHWVWASPTLLTIVLTARRAGNRRMMYWACAGIVIFVASPQIWFPHTGNRELGWGWWEQIIGSSYVWVALGALLFAASPWSALAGRRATPNRATDV
jgi:alpha-1,2-mannosyltransferase